MTMPTMKYVRAAAALLLLCACGAVGAQNNPTTQYVVQITQVKPGMGAQWIAAQRDQVNPALKKAGIKSRTVLETVFGPLGEYVSITPLNYAQYDQSPGLLQRTLGQKEGDALAAKLASYVVSNVRYVVTRQDEFNVGNVDGPIRVTTTYRINPGQGDLYREFMRDRVLPLNKQGAQGGKILGFSTSITGQGSPEPGLWTQTTFLPNVEALGAPGLAAQVLGQPAAALLGRDGAQLRSVVRQTVRRRVADASF